MGVRYCSIDDVKNVARSLSMDFDRDDPTFDTEINSAIDEASNSFRIVASKRYDLSLIDSTIPLANNFTKTKAALLLTENRLEIVGTNENNMDRLKKRIKYYATEISNGNILDDNGDAVNKTSEGSLSKSSPLDSIWE